MKNPRLAELFEEVVNTKQEDPSQHFEEMSGFFDQSDLFGRIRILEGLTTMLRNIVGKMNSLSTNDKPQISINNDNQKAVNYLITRYQQVLNWFRSNLVSNFNVKELRSFILFFESNKTHLHGPRHKVNKDLIDVHNALYTQNPSYQSEYDDFVAALTSP